MIAASFSRRALFNDFFGAPRTVHPTDFMQSAYQRVIALDIIKKRTVRKVRTLKDSFGNSIEYVTYRQEKDEELLKFLVLFVFMLFRKLLKK